MLELKELYPREAYVIGWVDLSAYLKMGKSTLQTYKRLGFTPKCLGQVRMTSFGKPSYVWLKTDVDYWEKHGPKPIDQRPIVNARKKNAL
jgi:hypothetical protein